MILIPQDGPLTSQILPRISGPMSHMDCSLLDSSRLPCRGRQAHLGCILLTPATLSHGFPVHGMRNAATLCWCFDVSLVVRKASTSLPSPIEPIEAAVPSPIIMSATRTPGNYDRSSVVNAHSSCTILPPVLSPIDF